MYCRFVQPNGDINCYAAQSKYWHDYPHVKDVSFPAYQHFKDVGKTQGNIWHSELCNACTQQDYSTQCSTLLAIGTPRNCSWGLRNILDCILT